MATGCSCSDAPIRFSVPADLTDYAPDSAAGIELCPQCLALAPIDPAPIEGPPAFDRLDSSFPDGEAGVVMALALGLIADSVALNRAAIGALFERAADAGADPWLALERLAVTPTAAGEVDLDRARTQLDQLLE